MSRNVVAPKDETCVVPRFVDALREADLYESHPSGSTEPIAAPQSTLPGTATGSTRCTHAALDSAMRFTGLSLRCSELSSHKADLPALAAVVFRHCYEIWIGEELT